MVDFHAKISFNLDVHRFAKKEQKFKIMSKILIILKKTVYIRIFTGEAGNPHGPSLVTLHDIGLSGFSNFHPFWENSWCCGIASKFTLLNISLPGQEAGAESLPPHYSYPSMVRS